MGKRPSRLSASRVRALAAVTGAAVAVALTLGATGTATATASPSPSPTPAPRLTTSQARALQAKIVAGAAGPVTSVLDFCGVHRLRCDAQVLAARGSSRPLSAFVPFGFGARDLQSAYGVAHAGGVAGTIAIIDAGAYPTIDSDLNVYRHQYGLPACRTSTGCFSVHDYQGGPPLQPATTKRGKWIEEAVAVETSLDLDMASAACPHCHLLLLQVPYQDAVAGRLKATHAAQDHFATAVQTARSLGADAVSISYGYPTDDYAAAGPPAQQMDVSGMVVSASTGDSGYNGLFPPWPQVLPSVIAVGGTELSRASDGTWHEAVWDLGGSGCSAGYTAPAFGQPARISRLCNGFRASADVSAVADPQTGVSVYDTYAPASNLPLGWIVVGGTSASSPLVAGLYARAGVPAQVHGPNRLYAQPARDLRDVVAGANAPRGVCSSDGISERLCSADHGWDGPTGLGSPLGLRTFR